MSTPAAQGTPARSTNRTDVQSNLLADRIERWFLQIKPLLPWILVAIVALITVAIIISLVSGRAAKREATGWSDIYFSQTQASQLETVAQDYTGTTAALWAQQIAADAKLNEALMQVYLDRNIALQKLQEARTEYQSVADNTRDPMLAVRAQLGIAKTYDSEANADAAIEAYRQVMSMEGADERLQQTIADRIEFIQSDRGKEFFAWFKSNAPADPRPVGAAEDLKKLPETPDIKFTPLENPLGSPSGSSEPPAASDQIAIPDASAPAVATEDPTSADAIQIPNAAAETEEAP